MRSLVEADGFLPFYTLSRRAVPPATTWCLVIIRASVHAYACVFPALMQSVCSVALQEDTGPWLFGLPVETSQPQLQHEQLGEQLPAGKTSKAGSLLTRMPTRLRPGLLQLGAMCSDAFIFFFF